jgi:hypothetical protein
MAGGFNIHLLLYFYVGVSGFEVITTYLRKFALATKSVDDI